jgi:hypothetical protein
MENLPVPKPRWLLDRVLAQPCPPPEFPSVRRHDESAPSLVLRGSQVSGTGQRLLLRRACGTGLGERSRRRWTGCKVSCRRSVASSLSKPDLCDLQTRGLRLVANAERHPLIRS